MALVDWSANNHCLVGSNSLLSKPGFRANVHGLLLNHVKMPSPGNICMHVPHRSAAAPTM